MNSKEFDSYKISLEKYSEFIPLLGNYIKKRSDSLEKKLMSIAEICLTYKEENRLSAKELKGILYN